jgi:hypothetical protein
MSETRTREPNIYRVTGPGEAVTYVQAATKAGAVAAVARAHLEASRCTARELLQAGVTLDQVLDGSTE